jgi:hypothetical protein
VLRVTTNVPSRSLLKSLALHGLVLAGVFLLPDDVLRRSADPEEVDVVFHRPPQPVEIPIPPVPLRTAGGPSAAGPKSPAPAASPARTASPDPTPAAGAPLAMDIPGVPEGAQDVPPIAEPPQPTVGKSGILAFRDQIASVAEDKTTPKLGGARYGAADESTSSKRTFVLNAIPGGSGGINAAGLTRNLGGGGGGGTGGGGGMQGVAVGRASSSIASIGGGSGSGGGRGSGPGGPGGAGDGSSAHTGVGNARTDEEIQIVFDRHKASFYRLYHQQLRNDPTLKGQMVLRLTIEPDGSVSMCTLQSSDMKAPQLAAQVVDRVRAINFGAKDVQALTIVYPIDFLPAA